MGGAQFSWRVTLLEGSGSDGVFRLEGHSIPLGEAKPADVPYKEIAPRLTYPELVYTVPYVGNEVGQKALGLTPENSKIEYYFDRHMGV